MECIQNFPEVGKERRKNNKTAIKHIAAIDTRAATTVKGGSSSTANLMNKNEGLHIAVRHMESISFLYGVMEASD